MEATAQAHTSADTATPDAEFEDLVLPLRDELFGCAMRYTRCPHAAQDLVQETLLRAFGAWDRFEPGSNPRAWAFRILTNTFINGYRRKQRHRRFANDNPSDALQALYGTSRPRKAADPEAAMFSEFLSDEVVSALDSLPAEYQRVVALTDLGGVKYRDAADELGVPIGTVMSRLFRARRMLEERLREFAAATYGIARTA